MCGRRLGLGRGYKTDLPGVRFGQCNVVKAGRRQIDDPHLAATPRFESPVTFKGQITFFWLNDLTPTDLALAQNGLKDKASFRGIADPPIL